MAKADKPDPDAPEPRQVLRELVLYGLVAAVAFVVDLAVLTALVEVGKLPYLLAAVIAFVAGSLVAYGLCVRYVFRYRRLDDRRAEASLFVALGVIGLFVNVSLMAVGVEQFGLHYLVAKVCAAGFTVFLNFALRKLVLFTRLRSAASAGGPG